MQNQVAEHDFFKGWSIALETQTLKSFINEGGERSIYFLLLGAIGLLMIACANIANLFVSRTVESQQQLAISAAVGASKGQLFRRIFTEPALFNVTCRGACSSIYFCWFYIITKPSQ